MDIEFSIVQDQPLASQLPFFLTTQSMCLALGVSSLSFYTLSTNTENKYVTFYIDKVTHTRVRYDKLRKRRKISSPKKDLKDILRKLTRVFYMFPKHSANYGFIEGKSAIDAARKCLGTDVLIRVDLRDFFPTHQTPFIRRKLEEITQWPLGVCADVARICTLNGSLPQGAPTSPILSIILNYDLDVKIDRLATEYNLSYTRYADDLCFTGADRNNTLCWEFIYKLQEILHPFIIAWDKVDIMRNKTWSYLNGVCIDARDIPDSILELFPSSDVSDAHVSRNISKAIPTSIKRRTYVALKAIEDMLSLADVQVSCKGHSIYIVTKGRLSNADLKSIELVLPEINISKWSYNRYYVQTIQRMLGLHLNGAVRYPRQAYSKLRLEAFVAAKRNDEADLRRVRGRVAYLSRVDAGKAEKIREIIRKVLRAPEETPTH